MAHVSAGQLFFEVLWESRKVFVVVVVLMGFLFCFVILFYFLSCRSCLFLERKALSFYILTL